MQWFYSTLIRRAVFVAVLLIAGLIVWRLVIFQSDINKGLRALNEAYREQRPVETRFTGQAYAPFSATRGDGSDRVDSASLRRAERYADDAIAGNVGPAAHQLLGQIFLTKKEFDKAIEELDKAFQSDRNNAKICADMGAAFLEKARISLANGRVNQMSLESGRGAEYLARSQEHLNKALKLDPNLLEALFNRALVYENMILIEPAKADWREYLRKDPTSDWSVEANRKLNLLEQKKESSQTKDQLLKSFLEAYASTNDEAAWLAISRNRDLSGGPVTNFLVDDYLASAAKGEVEESEKKFDALMFAAKLEKERAGDLFATDLGRFIKLLSPTKRKKLIEARGLIEQGRQSLRDFKLEAAIEYLNEAKEILVEIGDTSEAVYVEYPLAHAYLVQLKSRLSLEIFERVAQQCESRHYKWLLAQTLNAIANAQIGLTNYSTALEASERSLKLSEEIGDTSGVTKTTSQLAQLYFYLGNYLKSLDLHHRGLELAEANPPEAIQVWRNFFSIPRPLSAIGLHSAAIEYEKEALRQAEKLKIHHHLARSYAILGLMYAGQGDYEEAIKNIETSIKVAEKLPSKTASKEALAYGSLQLGFAHRLSGDFNKAIANYDQAIQLYGELENFQAFSYVAHKGKLLSCINQEGCPSVEAEIKTCLDLFENYRTSILEASNRETFFDTEQDIYDIAIDYEFSRNNFQTAFEYSERARARSLLDLVSTPAQLIGEHDDEPDIRFKSANASKSFEEIRAVLPAKVQIIQYSVLGDKLLVWVISNTDFAHEQKAISLAELNEKLFRYLKLMSTPVAVHTEELNRLSLALYEIVIGPIERLLKHDYLLCIVPDKTLNYLPFAALLSRSGKYLVEDYQLMLASSSTVFVRSSELAKGKNNVAVESLLAVGNPAFNRETFPLLPDLPSAAQEAVEIKKYYDSPRSKVFVNEGATKKLVKSEIRRSDIAHLALHSIVDEAYPLRSKLVLANDKGPKESEDVLHAYEIYGMQLPVTRLVILSACETGVGRYYRGEGIMGLSRSFIASGVPLVIASLWRVDSDSTADLMIAFHRYRKTKNLSSVAALRKAQQDMLHRTDKYYRHPYYWAAFTPVGGYANY